MATLQNSIEGLKSDAVSFVKNAVSSIQDGFNSIVGNIGSRVSGLYSGDVVGINVDHIPAMQEAIRNYVNEIDKHLAEVNQNADTAQAFRGEYAAAVKVYVEAVCNACGALTSNLLKFNAVLEDVKAKYTAKDEELKSQLGNQASEMNSTFTRYTE